MTLIGATTENPYFEVNSALSRRARSTSCAPLEPPSTRSAARPRARRSRARDRRPARGRRRGAGAARRRARAATRGWRSRRSSARSRRARGRRPSGRPRHRRGRAAAQGAHLRPRGRPPLRLHLGLDQGDPRLGPRRLALLPGGDARGRRGPALHRPADGDPRLRGHRQRRPAGARRRQRRRRRRWTGWGCPSAGSTSPRPPPTWRWRRSRTPPTAASSGPRRHVREHGAKPPPPTCATPITPGRGSSAAAMGYVYPHDEPGGVADQPVMPEGLEGERFYEPTDRGFEAELRRRLEEIRRRLGASLADAPRATSRGSRVPGAPRRGLGP